MNAFLSIPFASMMYNIALLDFSAPINIIKIRKRENIKEKVHRCLPTSHAVGILPSTVIIQKQERSVDFKKVGSYSQVFTLS